MESSKENYFKPNGGFTPDGAKKYGFKKGNSFGFKKGYIPWNKDKNFVARDLKGKTLEELYGKEKADEIKSIVSKTHKGIPKGPFTEEHKRKMSENHADFRGEKSPRWKGGYSRNKVDEQDWRLKVYKRDNYTCQTCGDHNYNGRGSSIELEAHHILPWSIFYLFRYIVDNGITLCVRCHDMVHGMNVISQETKEEIRKLYNTGTYTQLQLADKFDIERGNVSKICRGVSLGTSKEKSSK